MRRVFIHAGRGVCERRESGIEDDDDGDVDDDDAGGVVWIESVEGVNDGGDDEGANAADAENVAASADQ